MNLFKNRTLQEQIGSLAKYLPNDRLFSAKNIQGSNIRSLLTGISGELVRAQGSLYQFSQEILPDSTERFISEWESMLGIPDSCFPADGDVDERRLHVLIKLASLGVQTNEDFVFIASQFGITVEIINGIDTIVFPVTFPIPMFDSESDARFTIIVRYSVESSSFFPVTFPVTFGTKELGIIECLFNKLKPAHCSVVFEQI